MKRTFTTFFKLSSLAIAIHLATTGLILHNWSQPAIAGPGFQTLSQPLYRYRSKKGYFLYTTSSEVPKLSNGPWINEGILCHVPAGPSHSVNTKPVYQLSKSDVLGVRYAYTGSFGEADNNKGGPADQYGIGKWMNQGEVF